jgi:hypothetical protein
VRGETIGGLIALMLAILLLREGVLWFNSPPGEAIPAQEKADIYLGEDFRVIGYTINSRELHPGDRLEVTVYWYPLRQSDINFSSFLHIYTWGPPVAQQDKLHPAGRAIREWWSPAGYIADPYIIDLPADFPPGEYNLRVGLYTFDYLPEGDTRDDWPNGYRPAVTDADGNPVGDGETVPLGTIVVR